MTHTCERCLKVFDKKSNYLTHQKRKFQCKSHETITNNQINQINSTLSLINSDNNINTIVINSNKCPKCGKHFYHKGNVKVHLEKSCKIVKNEQQQIINALKQMLINQTPTNVTNNVTNNNINIDNSTTNNNTTNNTQNIQVNIFSAGKEDLSRLSQEDILRICTAGTYYPIVAAEVIHCNKNYPEFQNFLISNLRSATGLVYANDGWISKTHDELLTSLMRIDKKHVSSLIKDLKVDDKYKVKLESTRDEIDTNESKEHQKPKIKAALYNASKMIVKNKKVKEKTLLEE